MSLKGLELQIAIPKTVDAGKMADQMQQQSLVNQANAQAATERQIEKNRETAQLRPGMSVIVKYKEK